MDIHTYFSQLGRKSASLISASERTAKAKKAAAKRWGNANGQHIDTKPLVSQPQQEHDTCKICGQVSTYHLPKYARILGGTYHEFQA